MIRMVARFVVSLTLVCSSLAQEISLFEHFQNQVKNEAHLMTASLLPSSALKPIFHLDLSLFVGGDVDESYATMMEHETNLRMKSGDDNKFPFIVCGNQQHSKAARYEIAKYDSGRLMMAYSSRHADVACWRASLTSNEADVLAKSSTFFHVSQVPAPGKFSPELITTDINDNVMPAPQTLAKGLVIRLDRNLDTNERAKLMKIWESNQFGLTSHEHLKHFFPTSRHHMSDSWKKTHSTALKTKCHQVIRGSFSNSSPTTYVHRIIFEKISKDNSEIDACVLSAFIYLATQNQVLNMEPIPSIELHSIEKVMPKLVKPAFMMDAANVANVEVGSNDHVSIVNTISTTALQSGDGTEPNPFWDLGFNGTGQFVEVADTGFDDASCFFRETGAAVVLTGDFNSDVQVGRSTYDATITDTDFRKIVQYVMRDPYIPSYGYDYESGHGTHCAGTVAGLIPDDGSSVSKDDYYSNCADYVDYCDTMFCSTCGDPGTCDSTCGFASIETYPGVAPGAKLMVYDFGDADGNLDVDNDMATNVLYPAYNEEARVFSNSWGSPAPYNYYDTRGFNIDEFVYDQEDALILFAAGNSGDATTDDSYLTGDASIISPGICKNVLTVGAAETAFTPDTVASFSSRGPSKDMRLKPEVVGPGDPVISARASGAAGLASCAATSKSGTSMATPAVAGAAALIRQMLTEGAHQMFSSDGYAGSDYSVNAPSAALMKAILIGSTTPLAYGYDSSGNMVTLADFYSTLTAVADSIAYPLGTNGVDFTQGFGHVRLSNVFSLDGSFDTFLYEDTIGEYDSWEKSMEVISTGTEVDVTLVWTDPPGAFYCGLDYEEGNGCLIHDLDLHVYNGDTRLYSNFGAGDGDYSGQEDIDNNAEKVTISTDSLTVGSTITVLVMSNGLAYADYQNFAVVITGNLGMESNVPVTAPAAAPVPAPVPAPAAVPVPAPATAPTQMPSDGGYCVSGNSTMEVLLGDATVKTTITNLKVGDNVLAKSTTGNIIYTPVRALPHSESTTPFIEIEMSPTLRLQATPFHTFPACGHGHKPVEAHKLTVGDCLQTVDGEQRITRINKTKSAQLDDTYSVVVDDWAASIAVGGVFTHARNNGMYHEPPAAVKKNLRHTKSNMKFIQKPNKN